jgi:imidazolonepropionase-like amidohydrolase
VSRRVTVHATGEPGTLFAAQAGVASIDHADQLSDETPSLNEGKTDFRRADLHHLRIFCRGARTSDTRLKCPGIQKADRRGRSRGRWLRRRAVSSWRSGARVCADGEVGHVAAGRAAGGLLNGAKLLGWDGQIGALEPGYLADVIAVPGDPLQDIGALQGVAVRDERRRGL